MAAKRTAARLRTRWRQRRLRKFDRFIADVTASRDPAVDFYYRKIHAEALRNTRAGRDAIAMLVGQRNAEDLYLLEASRIRRPGRILTAGAVVFSFSVAPFTGGVSGVLGFALGVASFSVRGGMDRYRGRHLVYANSVQQIRAYENPWERLETIHQRSWNKLLRTNVLTLPAQALCGGFRVEDILGRLDVADRELLETILALADGYEGSIGELLASAELLHH